MNSVFISAANCGKLTKMQEPHDSGVDVNATYRGITALTSALREDPTNQRTDEKQIAVVEWLITNGADVAACESSGYGPIHYAAKYGKVAIIERLVQERGSIVNQLISEVLGWTALHLAVLNGWYDAAVLLVEMGARTDMVALDKETKKELSWDDLIEGVPAERRGEKEKLKTLINSQQPSATFSTSSALQLDSSGLARGVL